MAQTNDALWGGRFASGPDDALAALSKSTHFDWRLATYDLAGTRAHLVALNAAGYLTDAEHQKLRSATEELEAKVRSGEFLPKQSEEDVHAALERGLIEIAGPDLAGKVRAGRSRNDQIATLIRSYLLDCADLIEGELVDYLSVLVELAKKHLGVSLPGRTHFQHAQPVLLSHHLLAHAWPMVRNLERLENWRSRARLSPYGAGALAGNTLGLDPNLVASELGFAGTTQNSMDATASRDVVAEFAFVAAMIAIDLSRFAEEIIVWSSFEFDYVKLDDAYSTGSSIMPQKKNPDIAELARGKAGRVLGNLTGLMTTLKGLPLSYNRDLQEDKEPVFDSVDTLLLVLPAFTGMVKTLNINVERMERLAPMGFSLATDVAEWLVKKGVPFRVAHEITGELVRECELAGVELSEASDELLARVSDFLEPAVREVTRVSVAIAARNGAGGTAASEVEKQLVQLTQLIARKDF